MLIDRQAKPWIITAATIFVVATLFYIPYHLNQPNGPSGSTWPGLIYGILGTAMIFFAMALTPRKKVRTMRIGRAYYWMQGHVWFGLLSFPVILYHAGFRAHLWGGVMTWALMLLFIAIEISGVVGLMLQQVLPSKLLRDVPYETIFEQIEHICSILRNEASEKITALTTRKVEQAFDLEAIPAGGTAVMATVTPGSKTLDEFYKNEIVPFLADHPNTHGQLAKPSTTILAFDKLRSRLPVELHETANDLQGIVEERRDLIRQKHLHRWLHGWLYIHIPLSAAMLVLIVVHIVYALRYVL
jgi:hypothetical protein